jgi:hypothetical protein
MSVTRGIDRDGFDARLKQDLDKMRNTVPEAHKADFDADRPRLEAILRDQWLQNGAYPAGFQVETK